LTGAATRTAGRRGEAPRNGTCDQAGQNVPAAP
jgi:hypothetical protein